MYINCFQKQPLLDNITSIQPTTTCVGLFNVAWILSFAMAYAPNGVATYMKEVFWWQLSTEGKTLWIIVQLWRDLSTFCWCREWSYWNAGWKSSAGKGEKKILWFERSSSAVSHTTKWEDRDEHLWLLGSGGGSRSDDIDSDLWCVRRGWQKVRR